jgi:ABC-type phosphate transport system auxiliary subunit
MSLTYDDLQAIRKIVEETVSPLRGDIEALNNDIKEIYAMISDLQSKMIPNAQFQKLSLEEKLLKLNSELLAAAKQAGITLPR